MTGLQPLFARRGVFRAYEDAAKQMRRCPGTQIRAPRPGVAPPPAPTVPPHTVINRRGHVKSNKIMPPMMNVVSNPGTK